MRDDGYLPQFFDGRATRADAEQLTVGKGEVVLDVDAVLAPAPSITRAGLGPEGQRSFPDLQDGNVHRIAIATAVSYGIASGRTDGTYGPADPVRRDQMATFLAGGLRVLGVRLPPDPPDAFSDDGSSGYHLAINQLAELGVISGKGGGRYAPAEAVSRGQLATFLVHGYEQATGFTLRVPIDAFADDGGTTHEDGIDKAATAGLTAGVDGSAYEPFGDVRRDQMATFVARLLDRVQRDQPRP